MNRFEIHFAADARVFEQGSELGTENQFTIELRVEQRFLPDTISGQEKRLRSLVPDCEGEHAAQVFWTVGAVLIVGVYYGFGVTIGVEPVAKLLQLPAQLAIVVNLAVENDPGGTVLIMNRLLTAFQIDDRQPAHCQAHALTEIKAVLVRAPVTNGLVHARD